ncbi:hypothetical protein [Halodesulfovibrio marinisediminis]|uniref:Uncharacterized protein n=1 Tax=Halodesulfovibrio marinisediminis DSM 17456 TaxID=1121457 RepID=A0A1N6I101_9BACT|nr:hypothetical protein [Halodesulfovibrio marinisediminis]SIO25724.1 hypothetical protein SAMN02745161_2332 [Halodesulfovibrio marinisediminis DSM 17456]
MQYYYSPSNSSCYVDSVHGSNIPDDCLKITIDEHHSINKALSKNESYILKRGKNEISIIENYPQLLQQELNSQRSIEIQHLLKVNDLASVRPLRAKVAGTATAEDDKRLAELEKQAQALRTELAKLRA